MILKELILSYMENDVRSWVLVSVVQT